MYNNFRYHTFSLLLLINLAAPRAANAQFTISHIDVSSIETRVMLLERISNAHGQVLNQLQKQISENQYEIDTLRGQIQENQFQLQKMFEHQRQIDKKVDNLKLSGTLLEEHSIENVIR